MREPHKHADLIKMWADGWEIEEYDEGWGKWVGQSSPSWSRYKQYRSRKDDVIETLCLTYKHGSIDNISLGEPNLKLTFDGQTGQLKQAEVIHHD